MFPTAGADKIELFLDESITLTYVTFKTPYFT